MTDDLLLIGVAWLIAATIVAWIATTQGRSPVHWFGVSVLLSPLIGFVAVVLSAPKKDATTVAADTPALPKERRSAAEPVLIIAIIAVAVIGVAYVVMSQTTDDLLRDVGDDLAAINGSADLPPAGTVWFGSSFDPDSMEIRGRTSSLRADEAFAIVARLPRSMDGSELMMRTSLNGSVTSTVPFGAEGSSDVWGFSAGSLMVPGSWTIQMTDIGGNVLASGDVTATE